MLPPRRVELHRVLFGGVPGNTGPEPQSDLRPEYNLEKSETNIIVSSRIVVTDYNRNPGDNFEVFQEQQAPSFVVPRTARTRGWSARQRPASPTSRRGRSSTSRSRAVSRRAPTPGHGSSDLPAAFRRRFRHRRPPRSQRRGQRASPRQGNVPSHRSLESSERLPAIMKTRDLVAMGIPAGSPRTTPNRFCSALRPQSGRMSDGAGRPQARGCVARGLRRG